LLHITGAQTFSEPEHLEEVRVGDRWGSGDDGDPPSWGEPGRGVPSPQWSGCVKQPRKQTEETDDHGEVLGAHRVAYRMLMEGTRRPDCVPVVRRVMRAAGALRRLADKVQGPVDAVAEEQRPYE
jgi:hypothetical protein